VTHFPRAAGLALALVLLAPAGAHAQFTPWARQAEERIGHATRELEITERAAPRFSTGGSRNADESESFPLVLEAGVSYVIVGACDNDCDRLGLVLARSGNDVTGDRGGSMPVLRYTPRTSVRFDVTVRMLECQVNPCWYAVAVFELP
jgi:phosphomannomutase